jgi:hypothetical protein
MQELILPDYLDGTRIVRDNIHLYNLYLCCHLIKYMHPVNDSLLEIKFDNNIIPQVDGIALPDLVPLLSHDESMKIFLRSYKGYKENINSKNYIFTKDLTHSLIKTKLDIKSKFLPKKFSGFILMRGLKDNDDEEIKGFFVDIKDEPTHFLYLGYIGYSEKYKGYTVSHLNIPLEDPEKPIKDLIQKHDHIYRGVNSDTLSKIKTEVNLENFNNFFEKTIKQGEYYDHFHALLNAIIYINSEQENLVEDKNVFSTKKSKKQTQQKIYTSKSFYIFGKNFNLPKEYTCGEIQVTGFWRWQPHGPQRSLLKRIFIAPHTRNYNKKDTILEV